MQGQDAARRATVRPTTAPAPNCDEPPKAARPVSLLGRGGGSTAVDGRTAEVVAACSRGANVGHEVARTPERQLRRS